MAIDRYSLSFGINKYSNPSAQLSGCVNDAEDWGALLASRGYDSKVYLDGQVTRNEVLSILEYAVGRLGYLDRLVVTYSGHGSWVPDTSGDEADTRDEVIVTQDMRFIKDDDLEAIFKKKPFGSRIAFVSDSCYSGSVNRFYHNGQRPRFISPVFLEGLETHEGLHVEPTTTRAFTATNYAVLLSGCGENEVSYDAWYGSRPNGAMTRAALDTYKPGMSWKTWHTAMRKVLPSEDYPQSPQLGATSYQSWQKAMA